MIKYCDRDSRINAIRENCKCNKMRHLCLIFSIAYINKINYNKYKSIDNNYIVLFY